MILTEYLKYRKKDIQDQIENIRRVYLQGLISKVELSKRREHIDIQLEMFRDMAEDIGIDWETL